MKRLTALLVVGLIALALSIGWAGDPAADALARMRTAVQAMPTYEVIIESHQVRKSKQEKLTIRMSYKAPGWVRTDVLEGKNKHAIAVYDPTTKRLRAKIPAMPVVGMSPDAKMALSLRGERIYEASFPAMLRRADRYLAKSSLTHGGQKSVAGRPCDVIVFTVPGPVEDDAVAIERWAIDTATHLPVYMEQRDADGNVLATSTYTKLVANPGFPPDQFTPFPGDGN